MHGTVRRGKATKKALHNVHEKDAREKDLLNGVKDEVIDCSKYTWKS